jgi:hypothetical protein
VHTLRLASIKLRWFALSLTLLFFPLTSFVVAPYLVLETDYLSISLNKAGYLTTISGKKNGKEYLPAGQQVPLLALYKGTEYLKPSSFDYTAGKKTAQIKYPDGSVAQIKMESKGSYLRFELVSLTNRKGVEAVMWGPYPTSINKLIGETIGVVRDDEFAIGIQSLKINTIEGIPDDGDNAGGGSFFDPLPGQKLPDAHKDKVGLPVDTDVNGDGDMPDYVRLYRGTAAVKKPYGSELRFYARDRRLPRQAKIGNKMQAVQPVNSDVIGSAIAFFGCPQSATLDVIEKIELAENLPHPMLNGIWVKSSQRTSDAYMLYEGNNVNQSLVYAKDLNFRLIHIGDVFKSWGHFELDTKRFNGAPAIREFTDKARKDSISIGIHTLTTFTQVHDPYVSPVPSDSLQKSGTSVLAKELEQDDETIFVEDPEPFKDPTGTRTIKIGKELIGYKAVSAQAPWQLTGCVRGQFKTSRASHKAGASVDKLLNSGYGGFLPDINLQDQYARRLAQVCNETGIDLMDFDGFEALDNTGHGTFAENKFIDLWYKNLDRYRMTCGSNTSHYYWHIYSYMNWGEPWYSSLRTSQVNYRIENQRYFERNLMPGMLGWFKLETEYRPEEIEWIQARSAGFNAGYLLRVDESIEKSGFKSELFTSIKEWQKARRAGAFNSAQREKFKNPKNEFHLVKKTENSWDLIPVHLQTGFEHKFRQLQTGEPVKSKFKVNNSNGAQPFQFYVTTTAVDANKTSSVNNLVIEINNYQTIEIGEALKAGDKIFCDGKAVFLCDATWNKIKEIKTGKLPQWSAGENEISVTSDFSDNQAPVLKLEFKSVGEPELVRAGK